MTPKKEKHDQSQTTQAIQMMKRILIHMRGEMDVLLRPYGVTTAQLVMLKAVRNSPGSSGAQLARECYVTPQSAQALIKQLEDGGFIVRDKDRVNGRIVKASITPAGERLLDTAEKTALELQESLWVGISDHDVETLHGLLARCLQNIGEEVTF
jgi:MarR family transcriptional regulator, organic hydroperoxide resistance regulator